MKTVRDILEDGVSNKTRQNKTQKKKTKKTNQPQKVGIFIVIVFAIDCHLLEDGLLRELLGGLFPIAVLDTGMDRVSWNKSEGHF